MMVLLLKQVHLQKDGGAGYELAVIAEPAWTVVVLTCRESEGYECGEKNEG